jgi:hypothetical protein
MAQEHWASTCKGLRLSLYCDSQGLLKESPSPIFSFMSTALHKYNQNLLSKELRLSLGVHCNGDGQLEANHDLWNNSVYLLLIFGGTEI